MFEKFNKIKWIKNEGYYEKWKTGRTGYPIVDAGIREMLVTHRPHNRTRLVMASFLIYNLGLNWREAAIWFSSQLVDSDSFVNNLGNWIWVSGTAPFSQEYYRIMSPVSQTKRFDPECEYIKKWIPELNTQQYPKPMVDHKEAREKCLKVYKEALG